MKPKSNRWIVLVLAAACGDSSAGGGSASSSGTGQAEHDSTSGAVTADATPDGSESATGSSYDTAGFIPTYDVGGGPICGSDEALTGFPCNVLHQDCPTGQKCSPHWWEYNGRVVPGDTSCVPIPDRAKTLGEACAIAGPAGSPCDDCDGSTRCWPEDGGHSCVAFCSGNRPDFTCPEDTACAWMWHAYFPLCLPRCDPLMPTCGAGFGCVLTDLQEFVCFPSLIDEPGALDQPCMPASGRPCAEGMTCIPATELGDACTSTFGCCRPVCDVADPSCARAESCVPYFEDPPAEHANLGVCTP